MTGNRQKPGRPIIRESLVYDKKDNNQSITPTHETAVQNIMTSLNGAIMVQFISDTNEFIRAGY